MDVGQYILRRLAHMVPVLFGITLVVFFMLRAIPGDPAELLLGTRASPETIAQLHVQLGLDKPLWQQYVIFLHDLSRGDLGTSMIYAQPVRGLILERLPATVFLLAYAATLSVLFTLPIATLAAIKKNTAVDQSIRGGFVLALSMPAFWVGLLLMLLLSIKLHLFPVSGYGDTFAERLWHLFLPALTISLSTTAILTRSLRSSIISVLTADYIETARAKGLRKRTIMVRHVLRNALISTVTILGVHLSWLIGGTVVIETVFSVPGLGYLMIHSIYTRDYPIVQGITLLFAVMVIILNLITDLSYSLLDPRVTYG